MESFDKTVPLAIGDAESSVRQALGDVGFGVLTEIDVAGTLQAKLGVSRAPLKILGACNPGFAHRALSLDPSLALVLPCNVVLEEVAEKTTHISVVDPRAILAPQGTDSLSASGELTSLAEEAAAALAKALEAVGN